MLYLPLLRLPHHGALREAATPHRAMPSDGTHLPLWLPTSVRAHLPLLLPTSVRAHRPLLLPTSVQTHVPLLWPTSVGAHLSLLLPRERVLPAPSPPSFTQRIALPLPSILADIPTWLRPLSVAPGTCLLVLCALGRIRLSRRRVVVVLLVRPRGI